MRFASYYFTLQWMGKEGKKGRSNCSTASALEIVGDRWSLVIIRDYVFVGYREYNDWLLMRESISTNILASRLAWLTDSGIFVKHPHPTNGKKYWYEITRKGLDLIPVIMSLAEWGWAHIPDAFTPQDIKRLFKKDRKGFLKVWKTNVQKRSKEYLEDNVEKAASLQR